MEESNKIQIEEMEPKQVGIITSKEEKAVINDSEKEFEHQKDTNREERICLLQLAALIVVWVIIVALLMHFEKQLDPNYGKPNVNNQNQPKPTTQNNNIQKTNDVKKNN